MNPHPSGLNRLGVGASRLSAQRHNSLGLFKCDFTAPDENDQPSALISPPNDLRPPFSPHIPASGEPAESDTESEAVLHAVVDSLSAERVEALVQKQEASKASLRRAKEELAEFNVLSESCYEALNHRLKTHTRTARALRTDIDTIFRRIRQLKARIARQYPEIHTYVQSLQPPLDDASDD